MMTNSECKFYTELITLCFGVRDLLKGMVSNAEVKIDWLTNNPPEEFQTLKPYINGVNKMIDDGLYDPEGSKRSIIQFNSSHNILNVAESCRKLAWNYYQFVIKDLGTVHDADLIEQDYLSYLKYQFGADSDLVEEWEAYLCWQKLVSDREGTSNSS